MQNINISILLALALAASGLSALEVTSGLSAPPNTLTKYEQAQGWRLLWDGKTSDGWRSVKSENFPTHGWSIANGVLSVNDAASGAPGGGNIITRERFASFELLADFKITSGANSGIKYFVQTKSDSDNYEGGGPGVGCEFQILDDERHPDAKMGRAGNRTLGSLYDLIPAVENKKVRAIGEWNTARIVVQKQHVEHWLNGEKVLVYDRGSAVFRASVAESKFSSIPAFGEWPTGHILLQEHGDHVQFQSIKIRVLSAD